MAFLKAMWKGHKHKKLCDELDLAPKIKGEDFELTQHPSVHPGSTLEGITFNVKYLGSTLVSTPSDPKETAEAVKSIVTIVSFNQKSINAKSTGKKGTPVQFAISLRGVTVTELDTKNNTLDISLYRISYCSADATYGHVFAFISTNDNDTMECHAFLCPKRKMAQLVSITVAQTFNTAYHLWQMTRGGTSFSSKLPINQNPPLMKGYINGLEGDNRKPSVLKQVITPLPLLIDLTTPIENNTMVRSKKQWASFDD